MENWKPVVGWETSYEVSDKGRVRSLDRRINNPRGFRNMQGRVLALHVNGKRSGYRSVMLSVDGAKARTCVHLMVLEAFVGPCPAGYQGCHNNGDTSDNTLLNLRWDTPKSNNADKKSHGTQPRGESSTASKVTAKDVVEIRRRAVTDLHKVIAADFGLSRQQIDKIVNRTRWAHI